MDEYEDDYDDGYTYDDDWLYVEDDCPLADDLAETQVADAGYAGTNYDIWYEQAEYDLYMFWDDQEYGHDEYWDYGGIGRRTNGTRPGQKRKSTEALDLASKRMRISQTQSASTVVAPHNEEIVVFMSQEERRRRVRGLAPLLKKQKKYAFLPDWRTRFSDKGSSEPTPMPAEMQKAAESPNDDEEEKDAVGPVVSQDQVDEVVDDVGDDEPEDDGAEERSLDPGALKAVLMQRLSEAGLNGVDENAYMEAITKMLSGAGAADDAVAELASSLLGRATNDEGDGVSGWLTQQGVSLNSAQDDDASSVATVDLPEAPPSTLKKSRLPISEDSPADSAVQVSSSANGSTNKPGRKVKFDVPSSTDSSQEKPAPKVGGKPDTIEKEGPPAARRKEQTDHAQHEEADGEDSDTIEVRPRGSSASSEPTQADIEHSKPKATRSSTKRKPSRKRKADSDDEDEGEVMPAPKRTRATRAQTRAAKSKK